VKKLILILVSLILVGCTAADRHPYYKDFNYRSAKYLARASFGSTTLLTNETITYVGYSNLNMENAQKEALRICEELKTLSTFASDLQKQQPCKITEAWLNSRHPENQEELKKIAEQKQKESQQAKIISEQRKLENEYGRYITQCEYIGFKKNTDKMGECVLKLYQTEASIAASNSQKRAADSADTLTNLVILNESLKLMNPPRKNFNCQARPFGIYTNVYCN